MAQVKHFKVKHLTRGLRLYLPTQAYLPTLKNRYQSHILYSFCLTKTCPYQLEFKFC